MAHSLRQWGLLGRREGAKGTTKQQPPFLADWFSAFAMRTVPGVSVNAAHSKATHSPAHRPRQVQNPEKKELCSNCGRWSADKHGTSVTIRCWEPGVTFGAFGWLPRSATPCGAGFVLRPAVPAALLECLAVGEPVCRFAHEQRGSAS